MPHEARLLSVVCLSLGLLVVLLRSQGVGSLLLNPFHIVPLYGFCFSLQVVQLGLVILKDLTALAEFSPPAENYIPSLLAGPWPHLNQQDHQNHSFLSPPSTVSPAPEP